MEGETDQSADHYETDRGEAVRVTVARAADILGVSVEAVRGRIKRGTLERETGEDGTVYVLLSPDQSRPDADQSTDRTQPAETLVNVSVREDLIDELRNRVAFLESELERRGDETERLHRIIGGLTQTAAQLSSRIPQELEAGVGEPGEPQRREDAPQSPGPGHTPTPEGEGSQASSERPEGRSWWRFWE